MLRTIACVLALSWATAGCYTYSPIPVTTVSPSMIVRLETDAAQRDERIEGRVFEVDGSTLSILPEVRPGMDDGPRVYRFSDVVSVNQRTLHTGRTLAIVGVGIAVGVGALLMADGEPGDTRGPGGPGDFDLIPILRGIIGH